jgi:hypothetical protein
MDDHTSDLCYQCPGQKIAADLCAFLDCKPEQIVETVAAKAEELRLLREQQGDDGGDDAEAGMNAAVEANPDNAEYVAQQQGGEPASWPETDCEADCASRMRDDMTGESLGLPCNCDGPLLDAQQQGGESDE